mmetsp:Transcript_28758/g.43896  ORF Transcript_28758/g.43896 Transcript_28758/m.43896 type:complete len:401 (+) Transcript_28758:2142-3344(+)
MRKLEKERDETERKEKRRLARAEKRRRKEELERLAAGREKEEELEKIAAKEKKTRAALARKQRKKIDLKPATSRTRNRDVEEGSLRTKRTKHDAKGEKFPSNKHKYQKSTTITFDSEGKGESLEKGQKSEKSWTGFDDLPLSLEHDEKANKIADGCLTQRPGLDIPTPKSHLSNDDNINDEGANRDKISWETSSTSSSRCEQKYKVARIKEGSLEIESKDVESGNITKQKLKHSIRSDKTVKSRGRREARDGVKELSKKSKLSLIRHNSREKRNTLSQKRSKDKFQKEDKVGSASIENKESSQKKKQRGTTSLDRSNKDELAKSDRSIGTKGSYRSQPSSRKRARQEITKPIQASGISSGERLPKSRRRKPQGSDHTSRKTKPVSVGILGDMGNDFNFNF